MIKNKTTKINPNVNGWYTKLNDRQCTEKFRDPMSVENKFPKAGALMNKAAGKVLKLVGVCIGGGGGEQVSNCRVEASKEDPAGNSSILKKEM